MVWCVKVLEQPEDPGLTSVTEPQWVTIKELRANLREGRKEPLKDL